MSEHTVLIDGANYSISEGKTKILVDGSEYTVSGGKINVNNTTQDINFAILPIQYQQVEYIDASNGAVCSLGNIQYCAWGADVYATCGETGYMNYKVLFNSSDSASNKFRYSLYYYIATYGTVQQYIGVYQYHEEDVGDIYQSLASFGRHYFRRTAVNQFTVDGTAATSYAVTNGAGVTYGGTTGNGLETKLYHFYISNDYTTTNIAHDYYPCYRKSDNVAGLYDIITGTFVSSSNSTAFVAGPKCNMVLGY